MKITLPEPLICLRCDPNHVWIPRPQKNPDLPRICPKCKRETWNTPKETNND